VRSSTPPSWTRWAHHTIISASPLRSTHQLAHNTTPEHSTSLGLRLLKAGSLEFSEPWQRRNVNTDYAVLSHTWREDGNEVSFQDMKAETAQCAKDKPSWAKIQYMSDQAQKDGLEHIWVDTCCIDKSSSAELSEAINSMFQWYLRARVCYVYLSDVDQSQGMGNFRRSRWFTRAWTLQELIAPPEVRFYDKSWTFLGKLSDKHLVQAVSDITGIDVNLLLHRSSLDDYSIAQRMSWAAHRHATRIEDLAYSLLGIFDVHMPMLYGEGSRAFTRLQLEIIKSSTDHSIFCWEHETDDPDRKTRSLLALSPSAFAGCGDVVPRPDSRLPRPFHMTNRGLEITLPIRSYLNDYEGSQYTFARLNCSRSHRMQEALGLNLERQFDLDAEEKNVFKPWQYQYRRRWQEAQDHFAERLFDWHFIASFARRGFAVGHSPDKSRIRSITDPSVYFREQTIVVLRNAASTVLPKEGVPRYIANPMTDFNELEFMAKLLFWGLQVASIAIVLYLLHCEGVKFRLRNLAWPSRHNFSPMAFDPPLLDDTRSSELEMMAAISRDHGAHLALPGENNVDSETAE
ncbi:hypothetical protein AC579_1182, partial [Pseudocercospora musae]